MRVPERHAQGGRLHINQNVKGSLAYFSVGPRNECVSSKASHISLEGKPKEYGRHGLAPRLNDILLRMGLLKPNSVIIRSCE